jgi:FtsH-binding integral membrane protein
MAFDPNETVARRWGTARTLDQAQIDVGLRQHMLGVYNYMASGLLLTGIVAYLVAASPAATALIFGTPLKWVAIFAPIALVFFFAARLHTMSFGAAQAVYWVYAALMGVALASVFLVYTGASIARCFFISAGMFGAMSLYGYTTKKDLSGWGSFLFMGVIGLFIASIVNIFLGSTMLQWAISVIALLVFTGLTAYDTQAIKEEYLESDDRETAGKKSIFGALRLYLDFINIFMSLMSLFGDRR